MLNIAYLYLVRLVGKAREFSSLSDFEIRHAMFTSKQNGLN